MAALVRYTCYAQSAQKLKSREYLVSSTTLANATKGKENTICKGNRLVDFAKRSARLIACNVLDVGISGTCKRWLAKLRSEISLKSLEPGQFGTRLDSGPADCAIRSNNCECCNWTVYLRHEDANRCSLLEPTRKCVCLVGARRIQPLFAPPNAVRNAIESCSTR